ncbi:hypothetical protein PspR84_04265 [Pseudomonas sp. R84]|uniref:hypothetical protein n=1 Tax=Pseudomonas sp. R84 TaxID=1573712 RepID=UPI00131F6284|nr:hypothetical protein [Pseudomonas sp. R84]QHC93872.1 hypothetical protein PspR84_04265 [Pseudomonas sp. R84]
MKLSFAAGVFAFFVVATAMAEEKKVAPIDAEMGGQVYLCGLKSQMAASAKGKQSKTISDDAQACATESRDKIKALVKSEYDKYPEGDVMRERIKALYSAYLSYLDSAMWGRDLTESKEARDFKDRVNDYKAEINLR